MNFSDDQKTIVNQTDREKYKLDDRWFIENSILKYSSEFMRLSKTINIRQNICLDFNGQKMIKKAYDVDQGFFWINADGIGGRRHEDREDWRKISWLQEYV